MIDLHVNSIAVSVFVVILVDFDKYWKNWDEQAFLPSYPDPELWGRHQPTSESFQPMMSNQPSEPAIMYIYMQSGVGHVHRCMNIAPPKYAICILCNTKIIVNMVNHKQTHQEGNWNFTPCTKWDCSQKPCRCKLTWNLKDIRRGWIGHSNVTFLDTHVSLAPTHVCLSVHPSVSPSYSRISILQASLVTLREKLKREDPNYF